MLKFNSGFVSKSNKGGSTMEFEGYCVKDKKKVTVKNGTVVVSANGRRMAKGTCPNCGTKVNRFLPSQDK